MTMRAFGPRPTDAFRVAGSMGELKFSGLCFVGECDADHFVANQ
jgi:hypothetical protein